MSYIVTLGPQVAETRPSSPIAYPDFLSAVRAAERQVAETGADRQVWEAAERGGVAIGVNCVRYLSAEG